MEDKRLSLASGIPDCKRSIKEGAMAGRRPHYDPQNLWICYMVKGTL